MPRVLIVEDDEDLRQFMECLLAAHGFDTISAWNGREALEKMRECQPAAIVLDLHMPVMDGFEFRRHQLRDPQHASVPVVAVTAHFDPREVEQSLGIKCLQKPLSVDHVVRELKQACGTT